MKRSAIAVAFSLAMLAGLPLAVQAQQATPCISCEIARENAEVSAAINRAIVQQQLQSDLQSRIHAQQNTLQTQQLLNTLNLRSSLDQNDWAMQQILLQERLNILRLEASQRAPAAKPKAKKTH